MNRRDDTHTTISSFLRDILSPIAMDSTRREPVNTPRVRSEFANTIESAPPVCDMISISFRGGPRVRDELTDGSKVVHPVCEMKSCIPLSDISSPPNNGSEVPTPRVRNEFCADVGVSSRQLPSKKSSICAFTTDLMRSSSCSASSSRISVWSVSATTSGSSTKVYSL